MHQAKPRVIYEKKNNGGKNTNHVLFAMRGPREFKGRAAGQSNRRQTGVGIRFPPPSEEHSAGKQAQGSMSCRSGSNVAVIELKRGLEGLMNNPSLLSCTASLASPAPFHRMLLLFSVILRARSWMSSVCVSGFFFQMKLVTCYLQLYRLCMSCIKGGLSCLSAAVSSFVFALRQTRGGNPSTLLEVFTPRHSHGTFPGSDASNAGSSAGKLHPGRGLLC